MKILFASRSFDNVMGGIERMSTTLMNEMVVRGHDVSLFTWDSHENARSFFSMDPSIVWYKLAAGNPKIKASFISRFKRALKIRKILKVTKPDVILAFQEGAYVALKIYSIGMGIPIICAIRESPFRYNQIKASPPFPVSCQMFRFAGAVTVQFERYKKAFPDYLRNKLFTIGNHIFESPALANTEGGEKKIIFSAGRLSPEKNHAVLIDAFSFIANDYPDWHLWIAGKGNEREKLEKQIAALNQSISKRIVLLGPLDDISPQLQKSQIYCQPSKWEGFPNSVAEAMAHALPSVGFEECDGVSDLIEHNKNGLLARGRDNAASLADSLSTLMKNPSLRSSLGEAALNMTRAFTPKNIFNQWEELLTRVAGK